jgi:hypothetical protein
LLNGTISAEVGLIGAALFMAAAAGLSVHARREATARIWICPGGLVMTRVARVQVCQWHEVLDFRFQQIGDVDLRFAEDTPLEVLREDWRPYVFIDSATSGKIVFRQHWRRIVFEEFADSEDLTREIVGRCSPFMAERVRNDINDGAAIEFGPLILSRDGLTHRGRILPWLQIEEVRFEDDSVIVSQLGDVQEWCRVRVNDLLLRTVLQLVISDLLPGK